MLGRLKSFSIKAIAFLCKHATQKLSVLHNNQEHGVPAREIVDGGGEINAIVPVRLVEEIWRVQNFLQIKVASLR